MTRLGIVGLPNVGKSAIFHAATYAPATISEMPFSTRALFQARLRVPGQRLPDIKLVDSPGLARGASRGEGLGNRFLEGLRDCDILVHVVRVFCRRSLAIEHPEGRIGPRHDIEIVEDELRLADLAAIHKRLHGSEADQAEPQARLALETVSRAIEGGQSARHMGIPRDELRDVLGLELLTGKPLIYIVNADEEDLYGDFGTVLPDDLRLRMELDNAPWFLVAGKLEADAASLGGREGVLMLRELGIQQPIGQRLAEAASHVLSLTGC